MVEDKKSVIETATEIASKMEAENKKFETLLQKREELLAREMLGGRSTASAPSTPNPEEEEKKKINAWLKPFGRTI
jgi:hypothetical protein